jgi:hypothetical protein
MYLQPSIVYVFVSLVMCDIVTHCYGRVCLEKLIMAQLVNLKIYIGPLQDHLSLIIRVVIQIESGGVCRWCITLRNTEFMDFAHRPEF